MRLYKREGSPYWWAELTVDGRKKRWSTKRPLSDKRGAEQVLAHEYKLHMDRTQLGVKPDITLSEAMERTLRTVEGKTLQSYTTSMRRWLGLGVFARKDHWSLTPEKLLSSITQGDLEDHLEARQAEGLAANSIILEVRFIQRVFNLHKRRFRVNPDLEFNKPKPFKKTRHLTDAEVDSLMDYLSSKEGPAYVKARDLGEFLLETGLRISEALTLEWTDVNLTAGLMEVYRDKTDTVTLVPLSEKAKAILKRQKGQAQPFPKMSRAVRLLRHAMVDHCNTSERTVKRRGKATPHTLRDTFATRLASKGLPLKQVSILLGHSNVAQTEKYAHFDGQQAAEDARKLMK